MKTIKDLTGDLSDKRVYLESIITNSKNTHNILYSNGSGGSMSFEIISENLIQLLRDLFILTTNSFMKSVITTVGKSRKMSEKQLNLIKKEMLNFDSLNISTII